MNRAPSMDVMAKLAILADAAKYDASCASSGSRRAGSATGLGSTQPNGICHSYTPDGRCVSLLKVLLTNHCIYDCLYCDSRMSSDAPRARFTPDEVVRLLLDFYRRNYVEGLFLSSGVVNSPDRTMEELIAVARTLREVHGFRGYIHLKAAPGVSGELIAAAGRYADRLSVNVEMASQRELDQLAPDKTIVGVEQLMSGIRARRDEATGKERGRHRAPAFAPAGQSTQMVVGATATADAEILSTADRLYRAHDLRRVYYSAYSPVDKAAPFLPRKPPGLVREHRLYQADWLLRYYGFRANELAVGERGSLDLAIDPKLAWALRHRGRFPVDVNTAERELLLRVPGLGKRSVERLLKVRRHQTLRLDDLARLAVSLRKVLPFVVTVDHRPTRLLERADLRAMMRTAQQLTLFA
jgi:putative DNA modification/repair radical SAM protein